jgi:thioredoxin-related protein
MKPYRYIIAFLAILAFGSLAFRIPDTDKFKDEKEAINWISFQEAEKLSKKNPRKIVVDVYTDWCSWCKKMDKSTFADEKVAKYVNKNFYAVKLDAETKEEILLNGKTYRFVANQGVNELAAELLQGKMGYPSTVYLDEKFNMITPVMGYYDTKKFDNLLHFSLKTSTKKCLLRNLKPRKSKFPSDLIICLRKRYGFKL